MSSEKTHPGSTRITASTYGHAPGREILGFKRGRQIKEVVARDGEFGACPGGRSASNVGHDVRHDVGVEQRACGSQSNNVPFV